MRTHSLNKRFHLVCSFIVLLSVILVVGLYYLQIVYNQKYKLCSDRNRIRVTHLLPKRGRILTADGQVIAWNIHKYRLIMERCSKGDFTKNMQLLSGKISLSQDDILSLEQKYKSRARFMVIKDELSWQEYVNISMMFFKFNNISIENGYIRGYPAPLVYSHITGYVSQNNQLQLQTGKSGIESYCNEKLTGTLGSLQTEINVLGKAIRHLSREDPTDGEDLTLTIDSKLQEYVHGLMSEHKAGGCVVMNLKGEILAIVSIPSYDANMLAGKMTHAQWQSISQNSLYPLMNRVTSCAYPPGSIFKIVVAYAALCEGVIDANTTVFCGGGIKQDGHTFHCWNRGGHGKVNVRDAISYSCDCFFFEIAKKIGIDCIVKYAKLFGYGAVTGVELAGEVAGLLPDHSWKFLKYGTTWKPFETMIAGIGQGALLATLIQSAVMMARLYSENFDLSPTLLPVKTCRAEDKINTRVGSILKEALHQVCVKGTAANSCKVSYGIAGKTGSSQVRKLKKNMVGIDQTKIEWKYRDHAFFVGVAPYPKVDYVVAVFVEHGGGGARVAAPIARKIFDWLIVGVK